MMPNNLLPIWEQAKFLLSVGGGFWAAFSAYTYFKAKFEEATTKLEETSAGIKAVNAELKDQTTAIVRATDTQTTELRELRGDMKLIIQSMIQPMPRAARAARRKNKLDIGE